MATRFVFSLLLAVACSHAALASSSSVEDTCAKATATGSRTDLAPFCVATLQAAPGSDGADARGLAVIATNLTLANYTAAYGTIKALQQRGGWSEREQAALATCRQLYIEALNVVHSSIHALNTGQTQAYVADMGVVQRAATGCEDAFSSDGGGNGNRSATAQSPLQKVDDDAINLTTVAMLIVLIL
ncbi:hypothetical protein E2562_002678 [Oryza meyeriana var. granulata]|uniref:Pectinesterase inhibitor domain-containing protein n=1 Tax=Oryza meyeriana var. granulata TaxID=110450 RepID=A0A6G1BR67_9ORYZ|nr:hypothetical protein E2562_002678 [Oryza meyeriana var. granulata]